MVTYIDAATAPLKNTGQIRLYGPDDFAGMHRAGQLTARCLDALAERIVPGVTTQEIDDFVFDFGIRHDAIPATLNYRGLHQVDLHLDQPCRLPWHSQRQAAQGRRHRQYRRHLHP